MGFQDSARTILSELDALLSQVSEEEVERAITLIEGADKIFFHALGRAGFAGKSFVMRLMHMGREVYVLGETNTPNFGPDDLLVICSGSGATKQFVDIAEKAHALGGKVLVFTGTPGSPLASMAEGTITLKAPSKHHVRSADGFLVRAGDSHCGRRHCPHNDGALELERGDVLPALESRVASPNPTSQRRRT